MSNDAFMSVPNFGSLVPVVKKIITKSLKITKILLFKPVAL